jgi:Tol biopolymer transport system component
MTKGRVVYFLTALLCFVQGVSLGGRYHKRPWKASDAFRLQRIGDLQLSPDDQLLLFTINERSLEDNRNYSSIWVVPAEGGAAKSVTNPKGSASSPRWSPDGNKIAFFSADDEGLGLWTMSPDGSSKRKLTALERSNAYLGMRGNELSWSPDGSALAYTAAGPKYYPEVFQG